MRLLPLFLCSFALFQVIGQESISIKGKLVDAQLNRPIPNGRVILGGTSLTYETNSEGEFELTTPLTGERLLVCTANDFITKRLAIQLYLYLARRREQARKKMRRRQVPEKKVTTIPSRDCSHLCALI